MQLTNSGRRLFFFTPLAVETPTFELSLEDYRDAGAEIRDSWARSWIVCGSALSK